VGELQPNATATAQLVFKVDKNYSGQICNTGLIGSAALDPNAVNNSSEMCSNVLHVVTDVAVELTANTPRVAPGDPVSYTAKVVNRGPAATTGAQVTFTIPPSLTGASVELTGSTGGVSPLPACTTQGQTVICLIGDMPVDGDATYRITGTATGHSGDDVQLRARVSHDREDTDPTDDVAYADVMLATPGGGGRLPDTGVDVTAPTLGAAIAILAGLALLLGTRRRARRA
jgi:uncharacterized repeat protein (TIGR01451 family)/LPXTG-motif cell wall-anchored protein